MPAAAAHADGLLAGGGSGDGGSSSSGICNGSVLGMVIAVGSAVVLGGC
ncbi:MAG: hypothetical protein N838_22010 [Thiohalocapsa sp. PB-PSB1]|nr:MAG: hypothetical protein N838_20615 [Thiohalocapsa sp. PB-PSB1]QQO55620.1 MAG: hypothetical protein N838_22010 [Thiohalocapsa sp. PB-PSB1]